uniref:Uncharacterized protein n=1 Tax=Oryza nivara TaxID=4536 RepID=A0A0E0G2P8_ORYNI
MGMGVKENLCKIMVMTAFASNMAKFCPMHDLGPLEKESYALGFLASLDTPFGKRPQNTN